MEPSGEVQHRHRRIDDARSLRDALRYELSASGGQLHQLPDERELSKRLGCSRNALRDALSLLRDEHLIERRQGSGTLVVGTASSLEPTEIQSINDIIDSSRVRYELLGTKVVSATGAISGLLQVKEGERLLVISRLTTVDGSPTCLWESFIPEVRGRPLIEPRPELDFFEMLHEVLGIEATVVAMRVEAVLADASVTVPLQVAPGQPLLRYERVTSDDVGNVIALSFGRARADRVAMVVSGRRSFASKAAAVVGPRGAEADAAPCAENAELMQSGGSLFSDADDAARENDYRLGRASDAAGFIASSVTASILTDEASVGALEEQLS